MDARSADALGKRARKSTRGASWAMGWVFAQTSLLTFTPPSFKSQEFGLPSVLHAVVMMLGLCRG